MPTTGRARMRALRMKPTTVAYRPPMGKRGRANRFACCGCYPHICDKGLLCSRHLGSKFLLPLRIGQVEEIIV